MGEGVVIDKLVVDDIYTFVNWYFGEKCGDIKRYQYICVTKSDVGELFDHSSTVFERESILPNERGENGCNIFGDLIADGTSRGNNGTKRCSSFVNLRKLVELGGDRRSRIQMEAVFMFETFFFTTLRRLISCVVYLEVGSFSNFW